MAFAEVRFQGDFFHLGAAGGPQFSTTVVTVNSGFEQRNSNWNYARGKWECGNRVLNRNETQDILAFFNARRGKAVGFRFKDWSDYTDAGNGILDNGFGAAKKTFQMQKRYSSGGAEYIRKITKPVGSTMKFFVNGTDQTAKFTLDTTTGIATISTPLKTLQILTITKGTSTRIKTVGNHGLATGKSVFLSGIPSWEDLDQKFFSVSVYSANEFDVAVNTATETATYTAGGETKLFLQTTDAITWTGEFDVPVRFDVDNIETQVEAVEYINGNPSKGVGNVFVRLGTVPVLEIRT